MDKNKIYCGDCLEVMKDIPDKSIDLIYIDPPFFSNKNYDSKFGGFTDIWEGGMHGYLTWLNVRLLEMKRLLKPTGSIYVHCDWHASHYIKCELDKIFGYDNFQNEIVWWYKRWSNVSKNYQRMHDTILFYSKSKEYTFNIQYQPYSKPEVIEKTIRGVIKGKLQRLKDEHGKYIERTKENKGVPLHDVFELQHIQPTSKERIGYPTQKPESLLDRIIKTCTNKGDVVADFFCGTGTTSAVAQKLGRRWITSDINPSACKITKNRLKQILNPNLSKSSIKITTKRGKTKRYNLNYKEINKWEAKLNSENKPKTK